MTCTHTSMQTRYLFRIYQSTVSHSSTCIHTLTSYIYACHHARSYVSMQCKLIICFAYVTAPGHMHAYIHRFTHAYVCHSRLFCLNYIHMYIHTCIHDISPFSLHISWPFPCVRTVCMYAHLYVCMHVCMYMHVCT
jgi:hypothetical protein